MVVPSLATLAAGTLGLHAFALTTRMLGVLHYPAPTPHANPTTSHTNPKVLRYLWVIVDVHFTCMTPEECYKFRWQPSLHRLGVESAPTLDLFYPCTCIVHAL